MNDVDLGRRIDRSFADGPDHRPLEQRIRAGRRALLRRRLASGAATLAVLGAVGTAYAVLPTGSGVRTGEVAVDPSPPGPDLSPSSPDAKPGELPVYYLEDGLETGPGVVVHERIENPYGETAPRMSDALDLTYEGQRQWVVIAGEPGSYGLAASVPSGDFAGFRDWVREQARENGVPTPHLLQLTFEGEVVPAAGAEIVQRTDDPRIGAGFAPPGAPQGAAVVVARGGQDYFVVWRVRHLRLDTFVAPPGDVVGATFGELLSYARGKYASGEWK